MDIQAYESQSVSLVLMAVLNAAVRDLPVTLSFQVYCLWVSVMIAYVCNVTFNLKSDVLILKSVQCGYWWVLSTIFLLLACWLTPETNMAIDGNLFAASGIWLPSRVDSIQFQLQRIFDLAISLCFAFHLQLCLIICCKQAIQGNDCIG